MPMTYLFHRARILSLILLAISIIPTLAGETKSARQLHFGNGLVERELSYNAPAASFATTALRLKGNHTRWVSGKTPSAEYLLTMTDPANGKQHKLSSNDSHQLVKYRRETAADGATTLTVAMQRKDLPLTIEMHYASYPGHAILRQWATITNTGTTPLVIDEVSLLALQLGVKPADLEGLYGMERLWEAKERPLWFKQHTLDLAKEKEVTFESGHWKAAAWLSLRRKSADEGLIFGWETGLPAWCRVTAASAGSPSVQVTIRPAFQLQPGQSFEVPKAFISLYRGDLDEGCYQVQRFAEERIAWPNPGNDFPYVMFNSWGYERAIDDPLARTAIDLCGRLGLEVFVADFGWEDPDWIPLKKSFPNGLAPLSDLTRANG